VAFSTWAFFAIEKFPDFESKLLLNFKTSTPSYMVYGELGKYPLDIDIKVRTISFWSKLISGKQTKLSAIIYKCMYL
jgi:hypothetical protein